MPFSLLPTLEDDLVLLRPVQEQDFSALYQVAKDPLIWEQHPANDRYKREVFEAFFQDALGSKGALLVIDKATGEVIGSSRFKRVAGVDTAVEIGWTFLARNYWGRGYNQSMKKLMMDYAFQAFDEIIFYVGEENFRSQKAVEKIGGVRLPDDQQLIEKREGNYIYRIRKGS